MASKAKNQQNIKAALERYSKEELVDLMEHILRIYVLNESAKLNTQLSKPETIRELAGLSFSQLLTSLKSNLEVEELERFRVTPFTVYVRIGEMEFDLNGPTPILSRGGETEEARGASREEDDDDNLSPAERMDMVETRPWRTSYVAPKAPVSTVETPSMAELFANDKPGERGFSLSLEPPSAPEEDEFPPIAEFAPGDDPSVESVAGGGMDFAKTAQSREDSPAPQTAPPPALPEGEKQINPSNRFASLDLD